MATLSGLHLLNTRPSHQAEALTQAIQDLGGRVTACPTLSIRPLPFTLNASQRNADLVIFISPNAVNCFFSNINQRGCNNAENSSAKRILGLSKNDDRRGENLRATGVYTSVHEDGEQIFNKAYRVFRKSSIFAIGQATAEALSHFHIQAITPTSGENSEALLALPILQQVEAQHILLVKGKGGRPLLADTLRQRGAIVHELEVYVRELPHYSESFLWNIWHDASINIILFTSQQSMEQLFALLGEDAVPWIRETPCLVISNRLAETARALGIKTCLISETANILNCLIQFNQGMT